MGPLIGEQWREWAGTLEQYWPDGLQPECIHAIAVKQEDLRKLYELGAVGTEYMQEEAAYRGTLDPIRENDILQRKPFKFA